MLLKYYHRFRDTFPSVDDFKDLIKDNLFDDNIFNDNELEIAYYLLLSYWESPIGFVDEKPFILDITRKLMIKLPWLIHKMDVMDEIKNLDNFNLTNEIKRELVRTGLQTVEGSQLLKANETPQMGQNVDLLSDDFLSSSSRVANEGETGSEESTDETIKQTDTTFKSLMTKLGAVNYDFINEFINYFKGSFLTLHLGSEFFQ